MQMDAYLKKEQIGTLFVRMGAPEGGFREGAGGQGGPAQKLGMPVQIVFGRLLILGLKKGLQPRSATASINHNTRVHIFA
jgi:hypothetical protein